MHNILVFLQIIIMYLQNKSIIIVCFFKDNLFNLARSKLTLNIFFQVRVFCHRYIEKNKMF